MAKLKKMEAEGYNYIGVFLTFSCSRGCSYCLNELTVGPKQRSLKDGEKWREKWIDSLNRLDTDMPLTFNGGEPLLHKEFFGIVNGLKESLKIDLLTTLPIDAQEFIRNLNPKRFERDLPYSAIRITFHPKTMDSDETIDKMDLDETIDKVEIIKEAGFDIMMNLVDHPYHVQQTNWIKKRIEERGIGCTIKPFLGYLDGVLYGQYKYKDACSEKFCKNVKCRTSILLIDPLGDVYRCYADMFTRNSQGLLGNIFDAEFRPSRIYKSCTNFGHCHPCDVQTKVDRFGKWGYAVVDIDSKDVVTVENPIIDWR